MCPKIWNPKPTRRDLSFDILHDYFYKNLIVALDDLAPPPRMAPKYEIRNLLVETFHLIYYMITFKKTLTFCTWWPYPTPLGSAPKYEIRNLLVKTFHLIYYMITFKKNFNFLHLMTLPYPFGSAPKYEIRNLLVETFHLIYYMTTFKKTIIFALDDLAPAPRKAPKYETRNLLVETFPLIYYTTTFKNTLTFCTWWPCPTPSEVPQDMKSETYSSRPFIWYTTWLLLKNFNFLHLMTLPQPLGSVPKYEIRNLLVETFQLIYYMTTF